MTSLDRESTLDGLALALAAARMVAWDWDVGADGTVLIAGDLETVFGPPGDTALERFSALMDRVHPDDRPGLEHHMEGALEGRGGYRASFRIVHPDGSLHAAVSDGALRTGPDGRVRLVGTTRLVDLDPPLLAPDGRSPDVAAAAQARLDALFQTAPIGLALLDAEARYVQVNETVARSAGRPALAFAGRRPEEIWNPQTGAIIDEAVRRALATGTACEDVTLVSDGDGDPGEHWSADFFPATSADGTRIGVGMIAREVTDEVETELARARTTQRTTTLAAVGQLLEAGLDSYGTLERLARVVVEHMADWCLIDLLVDDQLRRAVAHHHDPAEVRRGRRSEPGEAELTRRVATDGGSARLGPGLLCVALRARGRPLGVLTLVTHRASGYDEDDHALAVELGRRAALAVDNAQLYRAGLREQRRSEEARATLDGYLERAPVGFALFDDTLCFVRVNAALAAITGIDAAAHLGRTAAELLGEVGAAMATGLERVRATGEAQLDVELGGVLPAQRGAERRWLMSFYRVRLPDGDAFGIGATVVETTEHLLAEKALTDQRDLYETLLRAQSQMGEAFVLLQGSRVIYVNEAAERMTGRSAAELYALTSLRVLFAPEAVAAIGERIAAVGARREGAAGIETELVTPAGERRTVELSAQPLEAGAPDRIVVVARDVSARHREELERERLLRAEQQARRETELAHRDARALAALSEILDRSMDLAETMPEACRLLLAEGADTVRIDLVERGGVALRCAAVVAADPTADGHTGPLVGREQPIVGEHPRARVLQSGRALWQDVLSASYVREMAGPADPDEVASPSLALLPLWSRGAKVGVIGFGWEEEGRLPAQPRRRHLEELARRLAIGVDNAQLYHERAHIASTLQAGLLPPALPAIPRMQTAAHYLPAGAAAEVGGDFYDLFPVAPGRWALVVGDVCGKGAEAAAVTAMARYTLRAASVAGASGPAEAFALLNDTMVAEQVPARFLTAVLGEVEPAGDHALVRLACAGHPAPIVVRADGSLEAFDEGGGGLLGVVPGLRWEERTLRLEAGDAMVLYTDGITEADRRRPLGAAELAVELGATLGDRAPGSAEALANALRTLAHARAGGPLRDDVAIVALRLEP